LLFSVYLFYVAAMFLRDRRWPQPGSPVRGPWVNPSFHWNRLNSVLDEMGSDEITCEM